MRWDELLGGRELRNFTAVWLVVSPLINEQGPELGAVEKVHDVHLWFLFLKAGSWTPGMARDPAFGGFFPGQLCFS